jgi:alanyl-tRNA synthetase
VRRQAVANAHTATHLLHWALQQTLGAHVRQAGSVVEPERLRFDFSHHKSLTPEELAQIEQMVNEAIRANYPVESSEMAYAEAQKRRDIQQFFGEKYGSLVRVIEAGPSKELCGGTHTTSTGTIGLLRVTREGSISAGVRRIEAVVGAEAMNFSRQAELLCDQIGEKLKSPAGQILSRLDGLLEENRKLQQELSHYQRRELNSMALQLAQRRREVGLAPAIIERADLGTEQLRELIDQLAQLCPDAIIVLGGRQEERCQLIARVAPDWVARGLGADKLLRELAPLIGGGAGGRPNAAQAGGRNPEALDVALARADQLITLWSSSGS